MANKIRLWEVDSCRQPTEIISGEISLEEHLEDWLESDISMLDPNLLVIGRQVRTDFGGEIDLLCLDSAGNVVVVELKRHRTPREVTAQALDYASWAQNLTYAQIEQIANLHFAKDSSTLADQLEERFGKDLPSTLNDGHRTIIVAASMDDATERIVGYLSNMGVPINVATVQYFTAADDREFLAQVFLVEPEIAAARARPGRRQPALTVGEMAALADDNGISELYQVFRAQAMGMMSAAPWGLNGCVFQINVDGSMQSAIRLNLASSTSGQGMQCELRGSRLIEHFGISKETLEAALPEATESKPGNWNYICSFSTLDEVNEFLVVLRDPKLNRLQETS